MIKPKLNEQGYTLVIVLIVLVLFSIIGMGLMTMNMNSASKNISRENVTQAQDLSVKGLDYVLKELENKINMRLSLSGALPKDFPLILEDELLKYKCLPDGSAQESNKFSYPYSSTSSTSTGDATYCIESFTPHDGKTPEKTVTFISTGMASNREHTTKATYLIGAPTSGADDYAIISYKKNDANSGKLELHGGLSVTGNIHVGNQLTISNTSRYKGSLIESIYPILSSSAENSIHRLEVEKGTIYFKNALGANLNSKSNYKNSETLSNLTIDFDIKNRVENKKFTYNSPGVEEVSTWYYSALDRENHSSIKLLGYKVDANGDYAIDKFGNRILVSAYSNPLVTVGRNLNSLSEPKAVFSSTQNTRVVIGTLPIDKAKRTNLSWELTGDNKLATVAFPKNLALKYGIKIREELDPYKLSTNPKITLKNLKDDYVYVENNMLIGLDHLDEVNFDLFNNVLNVDALGILSSLESISNVETPVELNGTFYVNGNLVIAGARLTGNATFFVKGNTTIIFSEIGVKNDNKPEESNINIISHGEVKMAYIGNNHNEYLANIKKVDNWNTNGISSDYDAIVKTFTKLKESVDPLRYLRDDANRSVFNGLIHSDTKITLDAASSYLTINGSISAPEIYATSIKGRAEASCRDIGNTLTNIISPVLSPLLNFLGEVLKVVLGPLVGDYLANTIGNLVAKLVGNNESDNNMQYIVAAAGVSNGSNCFLKASEQDKDTLNSSGYLLSILGIDAVKFQELEYANESRLIINYSPKPLENLEAQFKTDFIKYDTIKKLNPPQALSRD